MSCGLTNKELYDALTNKYLLEEFWTWKKYYPDIPDIVFYEWRKQRDEWDKNFKRRRAELESAGLIPIDNGFLSIFDDDIIKKQQ